MQKFDNYGYFENEHKQSGIYAIVNALTDQYYIGSTSRKFHQRWANHRRALRKNFHHSTYLQNSWNKYGEDAFVFTILENMTGDTIENIRNREQFYLDKMDVLNREKSFNICDDVISVNTPSTSKLRTKPYVLINPDGIRYDTDHLGEFCKEHNLEWSNMTRVSNGEYLHSKFWRCFKGEDVPDYIMTKDEFSEFLEQQKRLSYKKRKKQQAKISYLVIDPNDRQYIVNNLGKFCEERGLLHSGIHCVARHKVLAYKLWRCYYLHDIPNPLLTTEEIIELQKGRRIDAGIKGNITMKDKSYYSNEKEYIIVSPEKITTEIRGLSRFCREHNLCASSMTMLAKRNLAGKKKKGHGHRGWECYFKQ